MADLELIMEATYVKKTMFLNKSFIQKAQKILKTKTEKDAVNRALEIVVEESEIIQAHMDIANTGNIETVFK
jgi:hypothetical protein